MTTIIDNVIVAGRPISVTHVARSAIRILTTCAAIGHAAGVAAGIAIQTVQQGSPVAFKDLSVGEIQALLRQQIAILD
jgi:hypothetical protein